MIRPRPHRACGSSHGEKANISACESRFVALRVCRGKSWGLYRLLLLNERAASLPVPTVNLVSDATVKIGSALSRAACLGKTRDFTCISPRDSRKAVATNTSQSRKIVGSLRAISFARPYGQTVV